MNRRVLAEAGVTRLEICPCGSYYLTVGPLTVSLHREVIEELTLMLGRGLAQARIDAERGSPAPGVPCPGDN